MKHTWQIAAVVTTSLFTLVGVTSTWSQTPELPPQPNIQTAAISGDAPTSKPGDFFPAGDLSLPPHGIPGQCFARVWEDPIYGTETEQVLAKQASERIEIIPAQYEFSEQQVLVQEASQREEVIPAIYETVTEKILVKPATTGWKKGRGLVEKVDNFTGEIMCLVEFPAEYKTITRQVVKTPATKKLIQVPAEFNTVKVKKLVHPAEEKHIPILAEYQTLERTVLTSPGRMTWKSVQCETNAPAPAPQVKAPAPRPITAIYAQSKAPATPKEKDNWFFLWDYDKLFDDGKWVKAERTQ